MLDVGRQTPLRSPSSPVSQSTWNFGTMNSDRPLVPGPPTLDALGPREHQVDDVVLEVVLGAGDEALDALDVPRAVGLRDRLGAAGADVGARVGLGQHHRGAPGFWPTSWPTASARRCRGRQKTCANAGPEEYMCTPGLEPRIISETAQRRDDGIGVPPASRGQARVGPAAGLVGLVATSGSRRASSRCASPGRRRGGCGRCHEGRRRARWSPAARSRVSIERAVSTSRSAYGPVPSTSWRAEDLEEVELDVAQVGLVVPHRPCPSPRSRWSPAAVVLVSNLHDATRQ